MSTHTQKTSGYELKDGKPAENLMPRIKIAICDATGSVVDKVERPMAFFLGLEQEKPAV